MLKAGERVFHKKTSKFAVIEKVSPHPYATGDVIHLRYDDGATDITFYARELLTEQEIARLTEARDGYKARLESGVMFESPHAYDDCKEGYWRCVAQLAGVAAHEVNPMGFWFGGRSN